MKGTFKIIFAWCVSAFISVSSAQDVIERLDPGLDALIAADAKVVMIADLGVNGTAPTVEGPTWMPDATSPDGGYFLYSDRVKRELTRWSVNTPLSTAYAFNKLLPDMEDGISSSSGTARDPQGRLVFCSSAVHAVIRIEKDGTFTRLANQVNGITLNRPNDLSIKSNGAIFFTDNSRDPTGKAPPAVYLIKDGKVTTLITDLDTPNGIALSPDGKVLYVNNTSNKSIYRYDVLADDTVTNGKVFVNLSGHTEEGTTDGMRTDSMGNIYDTGPGGVWIISPEGTLLGRIRMPEALTNLAFGGTDGKTLFITGRQKVYYTSVKVPG